MKKIFFSSAFFMLVHLLCAQSDPVLTVKVSKVKEVKGYMMIAVYDSAEKFLSKELVIGARVAVDDEVITHHFKNLPYGNYAISVYHDVDSDGELATNFMGLPKEPYGFSNGGTNMFGVPSFKRSAFDYNKLKQEIKIELK